MGGSNPFRFLRHAELVSASILQQTQSMSGEMDPEPSSG
jgi:hypothetical protein